MGYTFNCYEITHYAIDKYYVYTKAVFLQELLPHAGYYIAPGYYIDRFLEGLERICFGSERSSTTICCDGCGSGLRSHSRYQKANRFNFLRFYFDYCTVDFFLFLVITNNSKVEA